MGFKNTCQSYFRLIAFAIFFAMLCSCSDRRHSLDDLFDAVLKNDINLLEYLIRGGKHDINGANYFGERPIHLACKLGYCGAVQILAENGASVSVRDHNGNSPLHSVAMAEYDLSSSSRDHVCVVNILIRYGVKPGLKNKQGQTARDLAKIYGESEIWKAIPSTANVRSIQTNSQNYANPTTTSTTASKANGTTTRRA